MGMKWTEEQSKVITLRDRNILVSAAAGSGKTAVLVQRILSKIMDPDRPVDIDRLLIMTFTRAAAGEMKERISNAIDQALYENPDNEHLQRQAALIHNAQITTIDGFCSYIIRNYFHMVELDPGYRTAEEGELKLLQEDVMKDLLEEAYEKADPKFLSLVECYASGKSDDEIRDMVYKLYQAAMSHPYPEEWLEECMEVYRVQTIEELRETNWIQLLWETLDEKLDQAEALTESARKICNEPDGPCFYDEALVDDLNFWREVRRCRETKDYDKVADILSGHTFAKLSAKRDSSIDPVKKEQAKELRDEEKEICKDLSTKFFNQKEEILLELIACAREPLEGLVELTLQFKEAFSSKKREKNLLDFTDMEHFALRILVEKVDGELIPTQAARELSEKYEEVMVDEYQDSNFVQELITTMVSGWVEKRKNIFMVGDVKQSIYRFRLARPELFMEKYHSYSLEDSEEQRIDLHKNFRSRAEVLTSVNYIFRQIMGEDLGGITYDDDNALYPGASFPEGADPEFTRTEVLIVEKDGEELEDEQGQKNAQELEALAIAQRIQKMVGNDRILDKETGEYREIGYGDIVILLRSATGWSETFSQVLSSRGIPVYSASRTGYFSAQEVVTLLNYLRVCDNPLQDIPLTGVLHSPIVGCDAQELAMIRSECPEGMIYDSICAYAEKNEGSQEEEEEKIRLRKKLRTFLEQLHMIRDMATYTPIHELTMYILKETGYGTYAKAIPGGAQRGANLHMLVEKAMDYEKTSYRGLFNFIRYIEKLQKYEVDFGEVNLADAGSGAVQIMTIHKSKGLEFPVVFVSGLANRFSNLDALSPVTVNADSYLAGYAIDRKNRAKKKTFARAAMLSVMNAEKLAEEIRILYVALSRAKEKLYMTAAVKDPGAEKAVFDYPLQTDFLIEASGQMRMELPYITRMEAGCFMDWILSALSMHIVSEDIVCRKDTYATWVLAKTGYQNRIPAGTNIDMSEKKAVQTEDELQLYEKYKELLDYTYPYKTEQAVKNKMSVTEIKRLAHRGEENPGSDLYQPPVTEAELTIPVLHSRIKEEPVKGNEMGTVIHKIMELIDFTRNSMDEIREQIRSFFDHGYLEERYREHVRADKIYNMVNSPLGIRMAEAQKNHTLYREQQFYIGMKPEDISPEYKDSKDMVVVQGVIDAYFLEGDQVVLMDYKTDRVDQISDLVSRYHVQLDMYAKTIHQLTGRMVTEKIIYAFHFDDSINL